MCSRGLGVLGTELLLLGCQVARVGSCEALRCRRRTGVLCLGLGLLVPRVSVANCVIAVAVLVGTVADFVRPSLGVLVLGPITKLGWVAVLPGALP